MTDAYERERPSARRRCECGSTMFVGISIIETSKEAITDVFVCHSCGAERWEPRE